VIAELVESGLEAEDRERQRFMELADRLRRLHGRRGAEAAQGRTRDPDVRSLMPRIRWTDLPPALQEGEFARTFLLRGEAAEGQKLS